MVVIEKKSGGNIGIMEKKMETSCPEHIWKLGQRCPRGSTEHPRLAESKGAMWLPLEFPGPRV